MMASHCGLCLLIVALVSVLSTTAEDLCTNKWDLSAEGSTSKELTVHHSSTFVPGKFTHLVWNWRHQRDHSPSATMWLSQHRKRGKLDGGFVAQFRSSPHLPTSFVWTLVNGTLEVTTHGDPQDLVQFSPWSLSVCDGLLVWRVTEDKDLYINFDGVNATRSLDESWAVDERLKRQAEFPTEPQRPRHTPHTNSTLAAWWRRFLDSIGATPRDDKPRSWVMDLTEMIFKMIFTGKRGQRPPPNIPGDPDAEVSLAGSGTWNQSQMALYPRHGLPDEPIFLDHRYCPYCLCCKIIKS